MKTTEIANITLANGGGTFDNKGNEVKPRSGYAVGAVKGTAIIVSAENPDLIGDAAKIIARRFPDAWIGTWLNDGSVHVDPVIWVPSLQVALKLARATSQEAIYSFKDGIEVPVI